MTLVVSKIQEDSFPEWMQVIRSVYGRWGDTEDIPPDPGENRFLVTSNGQAVGACAVHPFVVGRGPVDLTMGGVAAVATMPEYRGQGVASSLMRFAVRDMFESGFDISGLYPYRETFYENFGYGRCGWRYQIKCPQSRVPRVKSELQARRIDPTELTSLNEVYESFIRKRSGSPLRTDRDWTHRMGKKTPMVFAIGDPAEAYLWVNHDEFWGTVEVGEMAWTTLDGYEGCLQLLRSLCSNMSAVAWKEPPDSPMLARFLDQGMTMTVDRATMYRVINLESTLKKLFTSVTTSFSFRVRDDLCPLNSGTWRIAPDGIQKLTDGSKIDFEIGIKELSQVVMGSPSLDEQERIGSVEVLDSVGFQNACDAFGSWPVVCMEFF